jgi:hypothetical protein
VGFADEASTIALVVRRKQQAPRGDGGAAAGSVTRWWPQRVKTSMTFMFPGELPNLSKLDPHNFAFGGTVLHKHTRKPQRVRTSYTHKAHIQRHEGERGH